MLVGRTTVDIRARVAATICSSQKSLAFGIPFIKATFSHRPDQADIMVPLLLFAQIQLITCVTVFVPIFKHLIVKHELAHHHLVTDTGGWMQQFVCLCVYVCLCVCMYVCCLPS